jgi:hypothetical protein
VGFHGVIDRITVNIEGEAANTVIWTRRRTVGRGESWLDFACVSCGAPFDNQPALVVNAERFELGLCLRCAEVLAPDAIKIANEHLAIVG